jgi:chaperonin GroES
MKIKPLGERVVIKPDADDEIVGGIVIPGGAKDKPMTAKVVAVGTGRMDVNGKRVKLDVAVGDSILVGRYSGAEMKFEGETVRIINQGDILAIVG